MACWASLNIGRDDLRDPTTLVMSTFPLITRWWPQTQCDPGLLCWLLWRKVWWSCGEGRASWQMRGRQQSPAILDCVLWIVALALAGSAVVALVVVLLWWWRKVFFDAVFVAGSRWWWSPHESEVGFTWDTFALSGSLSQSNWVETQGGTAGSTLVEELG